MSTITGLRLHQTLVAAGLAIDGVRIGTLGVKSTYLVQPANLQVAAQPTIDAFDDSVAADATYLNTSARDAASTAMGGDGSASWKALRAAAAVLVDEINVIRQWQTNFKAAVAASTSLANLQTRVAALPDLPDRTLAQAKSAIQAKIAAGVVD